LAGEVVNVSVNGPYQYDSKCNAIADSSGAWSCHVTLSSDYTAEGSYTYTTVGQTSGITQSGTFTDAASNVNFNTNGLPNGISISVTGSGTNNGGHSISGPWVFNSPGGPSTNIGVQTGSQFTYSFPTSVSEINGAKYNLQSSTPQSPFMIVTGINSVTATYALADDMPPTTTDNSPTDWQNKDFTITLTCTDNTGGSGCKQTQYSVDGGALQTGTSVSISTEGDHTVTYSSVDNAGNTETTNLRFRVLRATDFKIFEKTHAALINIKNFE
jgi:hypothetical protein